MKWKIKKRPQVVYENEFLIFPRKYDGYYHWLCWATIQYTWLGWRYTRWGDVVAIGKQSEEFTKLDGRTQVYN